MRYMLKALGAAFASMMLCTPAAKAQAPETARAFSDFVTRGALAQADADFSRRTPDAQSVAALGMVKFLRAVENLGQGLHRYGLQPPSNMPMMPILRFPVPPNQKPEPLTYDKMRAVYATFLADLAAAEAVLQKMPDGPVKLPVDLMSVRLDLDANGVASDAETLGGILAALNGGRGGGSRPVAPPAWEVAFDRADVTWLRGYMNLTSAFVEFILAHDWHESYDATAHLFFAGARDPSGAFAAQGTLADLVVGRGGDRIADAIALVHLARWPLAEPARMGKAREHLKAVITLSRQNWKEILAETDDDREWVPGPHQKNTAFPGMAVTQARVDGWLAALDSFEQALDGRLLVPHWRYTKGIDLAAVFTSPRPFDLVLWMTGHAALPYLKDGPIMSRSDWEQWQRVFGGQFLSYAFWFN